MCGLAGFIEERSDRSRADLHAIVAAMAEALKHRGPDDAGTWADAAAGIALGHRRLSILDLSSAGHQPMVSADERWVIVYNGEVYNQPELRTELEARGHCFRGHSDTEVILEACASWGVEPAVARLNGMFAFAVWDRRERVLRLVRDRMGIKPLYWGRFGGLFLFGSELKALRAHSGWRSEVDRDALASFMRHNCVPAHHSIYRGVRKLEPGQILTLHTGQEPTTTTYWDTRAVARRGLAAPLEASDEQTIDRVEQLLRDAVRRRMVSDVPLGAFLSGGIDSSITVALMQAQSDRPVKTFSIGFPDAGFDEAPHAKAVAAHLGTDHTELYLSPERALELIPRLATLYDEPFADSSQIPTYLVAEMTRNHVTVALSGDGGDELFAGYNRYLWAPAVWRYAGRAPAGLRAKAAALLTALAPQTWDKILRFVPERARPPLLGAKLHKVASILALPDPNAIYRRLVSYWPEPDSLVLGAHEPHGAAWDPTLDEQFAALVARMQFLDQITYLPNDILTKVDRASMAVSLEVRVPLLDHRVVELAWRLPPSMKIRNGRGKWLLRQILYRHVPSHLVERPKSGFSIPLDAWLRGPLRDWAEALLDARRLRDQQFLDPEPVHHAWREHLSGRNDHAYILWNVLMFQAWLEEWRD